MSVYVRDIRRAIAQRIRDAGLPDLASEHVYTNRIRPFDDERLPAVCVFTVSETSSLAEVAPRVNACEAEVAITVYVRTAAREDSDEDDLLDPYLQAIRDLMGADDTCDGHAESSEYSGCDWILTSEGEFALGAGTLRFKVRYREQQPDPAGSDLSNLLRINVTYDGAPARDGSIDAEDDVRYGDPR